MKRFDQIIGAYYSPEVEGLKKQAWSSFRMAIGCGIAAVVIFAVLAGILFFSLTFQSNPFGNPLVLVFIIVGIPAFVILVPTSWVFAIRYILCCKKAKEAVDRTMRDAIRNEQAAGNTTPPPVPQP